MLAAGVYLGAHAFQSAVDLLNQQRQYQLAFLDIKLKHNPPSWFRGGAPTFLKQVRATAGEDEVLPLLKLKKGRIERDFRVFPWVDEVRRIEYPPGGIEVDLVYKTPVAVIPFRRGVQVVVDAHGHVLPAEDIDPRTLGALIKIMGTPTSPLVPSVDYPPGKALKSGAAGALGARQDRAVVRAANLAGFLDDPDRRQQAVRLPALRIVNIIATDDRGLFVQNAEETAILWGDAPGNEADDEPNAAEKWQILRRWAKNSGQRSLPNGDFWAFSGSDIASWELTAVRTSRGKEAARDGSGF
jgi:hypothetical protein